MRTRICMHTAFDAYIDRSTKGNEEVRNIVTDTNGRFDGLASQLQIVLD